MVSLNAENYILYYFRNFHRGHCENAKRYYIIRVRKTFTHVQIVTIFTRKDVKELILNTYIFYILAYFSKCTSLAPDFILFILKCMQDLTKQHYIHCLIFENMYGVFRISNVQILTFDNIKVMVDRHFWIISNSLFSII